MSADTIFGAANGRTYLVLSVALLIVAALLRLNDLSARSMWVDEAAAALYSQGTLAETLDNTRHNNTSPIVFPLILYAVQKIERSATVVRLPSAILSVLAVLVMLRLPRVGVDPRIAWLAGLALTLSSSQVHWAQEAREYSFATLVSAILIYALLAYRHSDGQRRGLLMAALFCAPFVQYGLALIGAAVIATAWLGNWFRGRTEFADAFRFGLALAAGSLINIAVTLRFQWGVRAFDHMAGFYFRDELTNVTGLASFLAGQTWSMFKYLLPGPLIVILFAAALAAMAWQLVLRRERFPGAVSATTLDTLLLFSLSMSVAVLTVILGVYPYGAAHQCLYLAPVLALAFGAAAVTASDALSDRWRDRRALALMALVTVLGILHLIRINPYAEFEDIKSVLAYLDREATEDLPVYAYPSAVYALRFYQVGADDYVYGTVYPQFDAEGFRRELEQAMNKGPGQVWIVLSSVVPDAETFVMSQVPADWQIEKRVDAAKSALYLASRPAAASD